MGRTEVFMERSERNPALDLVRIVATFCVITFHFNYINGFHHAQLIGVRMFILCIMRIASSICVPMFIILTGYLMRRKILTRSYYKGILKTLVIYVIASTACYLHSGGRLGSGLLLGLLDYTAAMYGWYIELYIGLFLMIPFLNSMYEGGAALEPGQRKKYKQILVLTLLALTSLPGVLNIFTLPGTPLRGAPDNAEYIKIVPSWWTSIYPITYYIIGCYLSEYGLKLRRRTFGLLFLAVVLFHGLFAYYRAGGMEYVMGIWEEQPSLLTVIPSVLAFEYIASADLGGISQKGKKLLKTLSDWCLGAYLVSQIFDNLFYSWLKNSVESVGYRLNYYPILVAAVFVCSFLLSGAINLLYNGGYSLIEKLGKRQKTGM